MQSFHVQSAAWNIFCYLLVFPSSSFFWEWKMWRSWGGSIKDPVSPYKGFVLVVAEFLEDVLGVGGAYADLGEPRQPLGRHVELSPDLWRAE